MSTQSSFIQTKACEAWPEAVMTAPSLLKQKPLQVGPVDRTRPSNKSALDHHLNIPCNWWIYVDGVAYIYIYCWQWNVLYIMYYLDCKGQNHNMGKVMFRNQSEFKVHIWTDACVMHRIRAMASFEKLRGQFSPSIFKFLPEKVLLKGRKWLNGFLSKSSFILKNKKVLNFFSFCLP